MEAEMLQLFFEKTDLSDSVAPVRWCIDQDMAREINSKRAQGYQTFAVLFDVLNTQSHRETRFVASLGEMMTFISFSGPGKNLVRAIVVYSRWDIRKIKAEFLYKSERGNQYHREVMFYDEFALDKDEVATKMNNFHCEMLPESEITDMEVTVPQKLFAKKPPKWLWKFVNHYFKGKPFEQCDFRKRALYAVPLGLIAMPVEIISTTFCKILAALVCILFGLRGINYRAIIHPFSENVDSVFYGTSPGDSYFWRSRGEHYYDDPPLRHPAFWPLTPVFPAFLILIFWLISVKINLLLWPVFLILGLGIPIAASALILIGHGLAILALAGLGTIVSASQFSFVSKLGEKWDRMMYEKDRKRMLKTRELRKQKEQEKTVKFEEGLKRVTCIGVPLVPRLEALPKEAKTIKLRFLDIKAGVCRPYAEE